MGGHGLDCSGRIGTGGRCW